MAAALGKAPNDTWAAAAAGAAVDGFASASSHSHYPVAGKCNLVDTVLEYAIQSISKRPLCCVKNLKRPCRKSLVLRIREN